ncbi:peptidase [Mycena rosella]|uniref:Peptide hydrolase n=1 Tax=Mycena rosella TaxID=1033263 RepID=A0AAD7G999_MYCRO|nr:peptidase [Mycena rosella]
MRFSFFPSTIALASSVVAQSNPGQIPFSSNGVVSDDRSNLSEDFELDALRLVQFSADDIEPTWMTERQKLEAKAQGMHFMDITDTPFLGWSKKKQFSYPAPNSTIVDGVLSGLSKTETRANLEHFTSYHTRYYDSETGKASSEWLYAKILGYTDELASEEQKQLISVKPIKHPWKQNSIVIRLAPLNASDSDPIVILGAHIDSINHDGPSLAAPGAGDDGSGTVTILEAYRALLLGNYLPVSPLEFHFYAGEEGGLRGSQALASSYEEVGKEVKGMVQFDMTAWHEAGTREEIAIMTNDVDAALTEFLILLVDRYLDIPWVKDHYPPGPRSDHVSWTKAGYQSSHPLEGRFKHTNSHIHGVEDRIDISPEFSFDHMLQFSKLAVAFAIELSSY